MVPTPRAVTLREPIREALRQMEDALSAVARFEPAAATQTFRISGSDYFSTLLMPRLGAAVMPEAPGVTLQMLDHPSSEALRLLGEGAIDMGVEARFDAAGVGVQPSRCSSRSSSRRRRRIIRSSPRPASSRAIASRPTSIARSRRS